MKLEQFIQVVEIAKTGSISKAAENLLMSQPGLSASVKQLERELGADLFVRNKKGVELTAVGSSFVSHAKNILGQVNSLAQLCKHDSAQVFQTLCVAACHFRFAGVAVAMLLNRHKEDGVRYVLRNGIPEDCVDWVAKGVCDVGIVYYDSEKEKDFGKLMQLKQLQFQKIYEVQASAIIGRGHPLYHTDATEIDAAELLKYPLIAHDQTTAKDYFHSVFLNTDRENLRVVITDRSAIYDVLEFSDAYTISVANDLAYRNIPRQPGTRELKIVNAAVPMRRTVAWIASFDPDTDPLTKEYLSLITDICTRTDWKADYPDFITPDAPA